MNEPSRSNQPSDAGDDASFEHSLERLEQIVERLEQGDLELEDALGAFEEGVALTKSCAARLEQVERRIDVLVREGRQWVARPFEADDSDAGERE